MKAPLLRQNNIAVAPCRDSGSSIDPGKIGDDCSTAFGKHTTATFISPLTPLFDMAARFSKGGCQAFLLALETDTIPETWPFQAAFLVADQSAALALIRSSCAGILAIPTADAKAQPLDHLTSAGTPVAFLSAKRVPGRKATRNSACFSTCVEALDWLRHQFSSSTNMLPEQELSSAKALTKRNYPHGPAGEYLAAAEHFRGAMLAFGNTDSEAMRRAQASFFEARADQAYYHEEDYFQAAAFYQRAWQLLLCEGSPPAVDLKKLAYLKAISIESIALALAAFGEAALARQMALESASRYQHASHFALPETLSSYRHTVAGLIGWSQLLQADQELLAGHTELAAASLKSAREQYDEALRQQPLWGESGFSDHYDNTLRDVHSLEKRIRQAKETPQ